MRAARSQTFSGSIAVRFINSAGIALVIMIAGKAQQVSQKVGVVGLSAHYQKIFDMIGLTDFLTLFQGEDVAIKLL